ncbi:hypothetical protein FRB97_008038 [Tulasnella sp. 331]|nr:hypothetical protein FRB97_008038 [Tulasnella sp. 331]
MTQVTSTPSLFDLLPVELLSTIFSFVPAYTATSDPDRIEVIPTHLISVSSRFRSVAIITPELWTTIVVPPLNKHIDHIPVYIARSTLLPLHLVVHLSPSVPAYQRRSVFKKRLSSLVPERHRWKSLHIHMAGRQWKDITSILPNDLPNLKGFRIECEELGGGLMTFDTKAHKMSKLETVRINMDWSLAPWRRLEEFQISHVICDDVYWHHFLKTVQLNVQLRFLRINALRKQGQANYLDAITRITLPNLHTLHITKMTSGNLVGQFLATVDASNLRELVISGAGHQTSSEWSFQGAPFSFPTLERLLLRDVPGAVQVVRQSLLWAPSVKHFAVIGQSQTSGVRGYTGTGQSISIALRGLPKPENTRHQLHLESLTTRGIPPHSIKVPLEEGRLGIIWESMVINIHVDDTALSGTGKEDDFHHLEETMTWLRKRVIVRLWGQPSGVRYRTWDAVQKRAWTEHTDAGSAGALEGVWSSLILQ